MWALHLADADRMDAGAGLTGTENARRLSLLREFGIADDDRPLATVAEIADFFDHAG